MIPLKMLWTVNLWLIALFPLWIVATQEDEGSRKSDPNLSPAQPHKKEDPERKAALKRYCQTYKRKNCSLLAEKQHQYAARIKAEDAIKAQEDINRERKGTFEMIVEHVPRLQPIQRELLPPKKRYRVKSQD